MIVKVQRWGNSLALRIPSSFAREVDLKEGTPVELSLRNGQIVIAPGAPRYCLEELLSKVHDANIHKEQPTGNPWGKELW